MDSTTQQLSTYPHLIPVDAIPSPIHQATSFHRRSPEIHRMSDQDMQMHRRSGSLVDLNYQDIIAHYNDTATKHSRMVSNSTTSEDDPDDRKGELRYDFRFGGEFDRRDTSYKPLRGRRERNNAFTVASARTLCSLSPEPSPPVSPSPQPPPSIFEEMPENELGIGSHSTIMPMAVEKHHGLYCRIKTFLVQFFRFHPDTTMIKVCSHKFCQGRCKNCDLPEAILPYLGGLKAGFYCKENGCGGYVDCSLMSDWETYGSEEDLRVAPLRIRSSMVASLLYADNQDTNTGSRSTIPDEAPQIGPIDFVPSAQRRTLFTSDYTSEHSIPPDVLHSESFFDSSPEPYATPEPFSSLTDYSLSTPPYLPAHNRNTSTPCPRPTIPSNKDDSTPSPQSTSSNEILEINVPATAIPILQATPTTIRIRRHSRTASHPPPTTPKESQSLHDIAHNAVHGDMQSQIMILKMYQDISSIGVHSASSSSLKSEADCHLVKKARLVLGLQVQESAGRVPGGLVGMVAVQLLSRDRKQAMRREAFAAYICQAVVEKELSEVRGNQILALAED
ncbi:hypothetical protein G6011_04165 [Alternaria panax]|uniref:Uncharacterized protein n=1 Tax=Alternaria panax TaxID=48097 RepID=A0AAD4IGC4_9PLEO|nr:hypothetical protein G6011_04165 [Alternaria panax]